MSDKTMDLPPGTTCGDCVHVYRCSTIFGVKKTDTGCDFYPIRFQQKPKGQTNEFKNPSFEHGENKKQETDDAT